MPDSPNATQIDYWNLTAGKVWVEMQAQLDRQIEPLGLKGLEAFDAQPGERVLDIGCGCGQTSVNLAEQVGAGGAVTGADISGPMLEVARARPVPAGAATPVFRQLDAQTGDLGEAAFDAAFSRFGVMFFADPVAAFANIGRSLKPGGRLVFVCWRPLAENLWMRAPMEAAAHLLPPSPPADPHAPGPYAFADPARVWDLLDAAGYRAIDARPFDTLVGGSSLEQTVNLSFRVGPLGSALREHPHLAEPARAAVTEALKPFETPEGVLMPAAVWIVRAGWPS